MASENGKDKPTHRIKSTPQTSGLAKETKNAISKSGEEVRGLASSLDTKIYSIIPLYTHNISFRPLKYILSGQRIARANLRRTYDQGTDLRDH